MSADGTRLRLTPARKVIIDVVHFARKQPSIPVARKMRLAATSRARNETAERPSWTAVFMKAYALTARHHPDLRRILMRWPWMHLYQHPGSVCSLAVEREIDGERTLLAAQIPAPDELSLVELNQRLKRLSNAPANEIQSFRALLLVGRLPLLLRRLLWWSALNVSGRGRASGVGTFGLSSYGRLGAEQLHPIAPVTTVLTFGPIADDGEVVVKVIYDHRVMDGASVARCLQRLEDTLTGEIVAELSDSSRLRRVTP